MGSGYFELESAMPVWKPTSALKMGSYFSPFYSGLTVLLRDNWHTIPAHTEVYNWRFSHVIGVVAQSLSHVRLFATSWTAAHQASLFLTISQSLPKFMSIALVMPSSHLSLWQPLLLLPSIFPSIREFSNESAVRTRWPKYRSFSFSISPSNKYSRLISLKIDWFDVLAVQGTLRSLLRHHKSKASILWHSAFFMVSSHNRKTTFKFSLS